LADGAGNRVLAVRDSRDHRLLRRHAGAHAQPDHRSRASARPTRRQAAALRHPHSDVRADGPAQRSIRSDTRRERGRCESPVSDYLLSRPLPSPLLGGVRHLTGSQVELITIGDELLLGFTIDTNAAHISRTLAEAGVAVVRRTTVGDEADRIADAVREALERTGAVITTGGLGPTSDDLTKPSIAKIFG